MSSYFSIIYSSPSSLLLLFLVFIFLKVRHKQTTTTTTIASKRTSIPTATPIIIIWLIMVAVSLVTGGELEVVGIGLVAPISVPIK